MKYRIISDCHAYHTKIEEYEGRPKDHRERQLRYIKNNIEQNDVLICLGDVTLCDGKEGAKAHQQLNAASKCKKRLVRGNHDRKSNNRYLSQGWDMVCEQFCTYHGGYFIRFVHAPELHWGKDKQWDNRGFDLTFKGHSHSKLSKVKHREHDFIVVSQELEDYMPRTLDFFLKEYQTYKQKEARRPRRKRFKLF